MKYNEKNKNIIINCVLLFFICIVLYIFLKDIPLFNSYNLGLKIIYIIFSSLTILSIIEILIKDKVLDIYIIFSFISYLLVLFITLYYRKGFTSSIENPEYIKKWIYIIFTNYTVFINIICNILLFIPLGIYSRFIDIRFIYKFIIIILFVVLIEAIQYIFKKGIFDYIDILLNLIGTVLGYILLYKKEGTYEK